MDENQNATPIAETPVVEPAQETTTPVETTKTKKGAIPTTDLDLIDLSKQIIGKWRESEFKIIYITPDEFEVLIQDFSNSYGQKRGAGASRSQISSQITDMKKEGNTNVESVKHYLVEKYNKAEAYKYYSEMGIEKVGSSYKFPKGNVQFLAAIEMLLKGIVNQGFSDKAYGSKYWSDFKNNLSELFEASNDKVSTIAENSGNKSTWRTQLKKVLNSLLLMIKANYPDTYKSVMRTWGFQKEKY